LEEAQDAAKRLPDVAQHGQPFALRQLMLKLANIGIGPLGIARFLNWLELPSPRGGNWSRSTVNGIVVKERRDAASRKRKR